MTGWQTMARQHKLFQTICLYFAIQKLKKEYDAALKSQASAKKQLEDETIMRVDLENRIQSLKEELAFQTEVHKQVASHRRLSVCTC